MNTIYAILIAGVLFGITIWLYYANKNTPVPEGCEDLTPNCSACGIASCSLRNAKKETEGDTKNG